MENYEKLITYAFRIISKKRYTCFEISRKLKIYSEKHGFKEDNIVSKVIIRLKELNYIDDLKYATDYINDRYKFKPRGKFLLSNELKKKGIDEDLINQTLNASDINENEIALFLLKKRALKFNNLPIKNQKIKAFNLLRSKGFNLDSIYNAINSYYNFILE